MIEKLFQISPVSNRNRSSPEWDEYAKRYILTKLDSIAINYPPYHRYYQTEDKREFANFLLEVVDDPSNLFYFNDFYS